MLKKQAFKRRKYVFIRSLSSFLYLNDLRLQSICVCLFIYYTEFRKNIGLVYVYILRNSLKFLLKGIFIDKVYTQKYVFSLVQITVHKKFILHKNITIKFYYYYHRKFSRLIDMYKNIHIQHNIICIDYYVTNKM